MPLAAQVVPAPETILGFVPGTDRKLVEWPALVEYYQELAAASDRVQYHELGKTTLGAPLVAVGLYQSHAASMDEGWTRWIFDTWDVPYESLQDSVIRSGNLARFDAIIIPDMDSQTIVEGLSASVYPKRYAGGIGTEGIRAIKDYVERGGTLVVFNQASRFAIEAFDLPARNVLEHFDTQEFFALGTLFRIDLDTAHALTETMPPHAAAWFQRGPAFEITGGENVRAVARYPVNPDSVLLSGWVLHPERTSGRAAIVEARVGAGRVVLFGFRPQYRAQSVGTYPLFFNALKPYRKTGTP